MNETEVPSNEKKTNIQVSKNFPNISKLIGFVGCEITLEDDKEYRFMAPFFVVDELGNICKLLVYEIISLIN